MRYGVVLLALGCTPGDDPQGKDGSPATDGTDPTEPTDPPDLDPPTVVINELMPGNESTLSPPSSDDKPDWIELVNVGVDPVPFSDLTLRNGDGDLWTGAEGDGELAPGDHALVYAGDGSGVDEIWTGFPIDKDGDELTLLSGEAVVDHVDFDEVESDIALARIPELTGELVPTAWPTPGLDNGDVASPTLNPANETVFRTDVVHDIQFTFTEQAFHQIDGGNRPEVHVEVAIDGVAYADVGLKLKGSASYDTMDGKPAFILDFNNWVEGTKFRGLKAIKLHNGNVLDPTRTHDHLSYRLAREAGLMAPRVGWAQVYCNGNDYGIYMVIEKHDDVMIEYHHPGQQDVGVIMEPNESQSGGFGWGDFGNGNLDWNYEEGPIPPDPATTESLQNADRLIGLAATDERVEELWSYVQKDQFLTYLAWETVVMHTDGYRSPNNWRLFVDGTTHLIEWSPSGAEWTWDSNVDTWSSNGAAARWCLQNAGCTYDYAEKLLMVAQLAEDLNLYGEFESLSTFLDPWIQSDPRYNAWVSVPQARQSTVQHLLDNPPDARQDVVQRFPELAP